MQALLIATAENEKLSPLTATKPSPLLSIGNRPVMEIVLEQLARSGFKQIVVCLYQMASDIEGYFGDGSRWGVTLEYVLLREERGSAGALYWSKSLLSEPFIVMPADAIIDLDIRAALEHHQQNHYTATIVLHKHGRRAERKLFSQDADVSVVNTLEKPYEQWCYETGVYIINPEALNLIPGQKRFDIDAHLLPALSEAGFQVGSFVMDEYWNPLESFCEFQGAQKSLLCSLWQEGPFPHEKFLSDYSQLLGKEISAGVWSGRNTVIHPSSRLIPPVLLADNVRVGKNVVIGPDVVVGANTIISDQASIHHSTIFDNTYVGQLIHIEGRLVDRNLVIDADSSEHIHISDQFLFNETPRSIPIRYLYRTLEVSLASFLLLITLPLTLPLGLLSWLSFRKVFQTELRLRMGASHSGTDNSPLEVIRLRHFPTRRSGGHITRAGRWLERLEWNRLPELWNVLTGDIRLVGTKPLALEEAVDPIANWQQEPNDQIPGITGLWYLQTDRCSDLDETIIANAYYAATRSWKEDARILLRTPAAWLNKILKPGCVNDIR
jgi:NDP-sugar pyrophosphorylase family protein